MNHPGWGGSEGFSALSEETGETWGAPALLPGLQGSPGLPKIWKQSSSLAVGLRACPTSDLSEGTAWNSIPFEVSPCTPAWPVWPAAFSSPSFWLPPRRVFSPSVTLAVSVSVGPGVTGTPSKMSSNVSSRGFSASGFSGLKCENTAGWQP